MDIIDTWDALSNSDHRSIKAGSKIVFFSLDA